jgi:hypothetical protein
MSFSTNSSAWAKPASPVIVNVASTATGWPTIRNRSVTRRSIMPAAVSRLTTCSCNALNFAGS